MPVVCSEHGPSYLEEVAVAASDRQWPPVNLQACARVVIKYDPGFALKDTWVTEHVTLADLFAHRSGLPDHAGDPLKDLGYDRGYIQIGNGNVGGRQIVDADSLERTHLPEILSAPPRAPSSRSNATASAGASATMITAAFG